MKEGLLLFCAFLITFFMGFFLCLGAFPYIISYFAKRVRIAYENVEYKEVFRWSVAFIVAFSLAIIICLIKK
mgnify:CR=1 FL=1